jgi:transcriptional regulator with XRE-family HTH domain
MDRIGFARAVRALRIRRRLTQDDLGSAVGVSRGVIAGIEQGRADKVTVARLDQVAAALGARITVRLSWNGEALDRLLDENHAEIVERVVRELRAANWIVATEVSFNVFGERGSIDVFAFQPAAGTLLVVEVKSVVPDIQATLVTLDRKARLAPRIAAEHGWRAVAVGRLLVVRDDRTARRRIEQHAVTFGTAFPDRVARVRTWLRAPDASQPLRGLWFLTSGSPPVARQRVRRSRRSRERGQAGRS